MLVDGECLRSYMPQNLFIYQTLTIANSNQPGNQGDLNPSHMHSQLPQSDYRRKKEEENKSGNKIQKQLFKMNGTHPGQAPNLNISKRPRTHTMHQTPSV